MIAVWSAAQIQGSRDYQEDRYAVVENNAILYRGTSYPLEPGMFPAHYSLYILADGMGGMGHGDEAASTVVEVFIEAFINLGHQALPTRSRLQAALDSANQAITDKVAVAPDKKGMGTTLIALLWDRQNDTVHRLSVGDSLLYRIRDTELEPLNEKHTFEHLAALAGAQGDTVRAAELAVLGGALSSAVDGRPIPAVDLPEQPDSVRVGDLVLLASDGLETLGEQQLLATLAGPMASWQQAMTTEQGTQAITNCRDALFGQLRDAGSPSQDNCTLIVIGWLRGNPLPSQAP